MCRGCIVTNDLPGARDSTAIVRLCLPESLARLDGTEQRITVSTGCRRGCHRRSKWHDGGRWRWRSSRCGGDVAHHRWGRRRRWRWSRRCRARRFRRLGGTTWRSGLRTRRGKDVTEQLLCKLVSCVSRGVELVVAAIIIVLLLDVVPVVIFVRRGRIVCYFDPRRYRAYGWRRQRRSRRRGGRRFEEWVRAAARRRSGRRTRGFLHHATEGVGRLVARRCGHRRRRGRRWSRRRGRHRGGLRRSRRSRGRGRH